MPMPILLCMMTKDARFVGRAIGVRRAVQLGTGTYLLLAGFPELTDSVRLSALPDGWAAQMDRHERGIQVRIRDRSGHPADHGFCLVVERGTNPRPAPVELVGARNDVVQAAAPK